MRRFLRLSLYFTIAVAMICSCGVIYARIARTDVKGVAPTDTILLCDDILDRYLASMNLVPTYSELIEQDSIARAQQRLEREVVIACVGDMVLGVNYPDNAPKLPVRWCTPL